MTNSGHIESCAEQHEGIGFVRADNLTPEQKRLYLLLAFLVASLPGPRRSVSSRM